MNDLELFLRLSFTGLALILTSISVASYAKIRHGKLALATLGFGLFTLEGTLLSLGAFLPTIEAFISTELLIAVSFIALIFFYLSILKR
jgi:hypothetical protein